MKLPAGWRLLQVALGAVLFLWALGWLSAAQLPRMPYAILAALLAAGAMWVTEALVTLLVAMLEKNVKGPRE